MNYPKDGAAAATRALSRGLLLLLALAGAAAAQSSDPKSPTPLTAGEIAGGEVEERASYYFSFEGGPGEVTAALEAKMKAGAKGGGVGVEIFDAQARPLASTLISGGLDAGKEKLQDELLKQLGKLTSAADSLGGGDAKRRTASVRVKQRQPLVLRLTVDKGVESFTLRVGGAVEFAQASSPEPTGEAVPPAGEAVPPAGEAVPPAGEAVPPAGEAVPPADEAVPPAGEAVPPASEAVPPTGEAVPPAGEAVPPATGKPAVVKIPGKRPAVVRIPGKQQQTTPPGVIKIPGRQTPQQQQTQPPPKKPGVIRIPGKKQT